MKLNTIYFWQCVALKDGSRTKPLAMTPVQLRDLLKENADDEYPAYVLCIGEAVIDETNELEEAFSSFPLVGVQTFIKYINGLEEEAA